MSAINDQIGAWHFCGNKLRDGSPVPADGEWLKHTGAVVIRQSGLHASKRIIDALQYAPGSTVCRVSCRDVVLEHDDKFVCTERRIDWRVENADDILRAFAREAALSVIHLWNAPDVVRDYLETGNEELRDAACDVARATAMADVMAAPRDAARATSRAAARDAARAASRATDWVTSRDAARAAARAASKATDWATSRDAAVTDFNAQLEKMIMEAHTG